MHSTWAMFLFSITCLKSNAFNMGYVFIFYNRSQVECIRCGLCFYFLLHVSSQMHLTWTMFLFSIIGPKSNTFDMGYVFIFYNRSQVECIQCGLCFYFL